MTDLLKSVEETDQIARDKRADSVSAAGAIDELLDRPDNERLREFKYRFAQAVVFGLPVIALQIFGYRLGGDDSPKWIGLFQLLLSGWVVYVGAAGLAFEGVLLLLRGRATLNLLISLVTIGAYLWSAWRWVGILGGKPSALYFHWSVAMLIAWSALQWARYSRAGHRPA